MEYSYLLILLCIYAAFHKVDQRTTKIPLSLTFILVIQNIQTFTQVVSTTQNSDVCLQNPFPWPVSEDTKFLLETTYVYNIVSRAS